MKKPNFKSYVLSIGINDYRYQTGGTNKVILSQAKMFEAEEISYVYLCPLYQELRQDLWEIIADGRYYGIRDKSGIIEMLCGWEQLDYRILEIQIHHLSRVRMETVNFLLRHVPCPVKFYIHDYYMICPSTKLLKNDLTFCGPGKMSSIKCKGCCYNTPEYQTIAEEISRLFDVFRDRIEFIVPSEAARSLWLEAYPEYIEETRVVSHQQFKGAYQGNIDTIRHQNPIKVAYIGEQTGTKGWECWKKLVSAAGMDQKIRFYYFGNAKEHLKHVKEVRVDFRIDQNDMIQKLRKHQIDCVMLWSTCPETYSYTYYESYAANAFVLTNPCSGNICRQVQKRENGLVLQNQEEVLTLFREKEKLIAFINDFRKKAIRGPLESIVNKDILPINHETLQYTILNPDQKERKSYWLFHLYLSAKIAFYKSRKEVCRLLCVLES